MPAFSSLLTQNSGPPLWLDYADYAGALLANGQVPWLQEAECIAWMRKAQGLLKSDVVSLPVERVVAAWLEANSELRTAMAERQRLTFPLKTLLADMSLRTLLTSLAAGLRESFPDTSLALCCPAPGRWLAQAYAQAHAGTVDVTHDAVEGAAMYMADFLRSFGEAGIDVLLLQAGSEDAAAGITACQPVLNVARHYRWSVGLLAEDGYLYTDMVDTDFVVSPQGPSGLLLTTDFWNGALPPACPPQGFFYSEVPAASAPENVLQRLQVLRS